MEKVKKVEKVEKVIVRADRAGVFFGEIVSRQGNEVVMANVRMIWYWSGAASLLQMSIDGVSKPDNCRFTVVVPMMTILDVISVIPCTEKAIKSIEGVPVWRV